MSVGVWDGAAAELAAAQAAKLGQGTDDDLSRLIGVNTRIASPSGASAGVGFAVPVNTVSRVVPQVIETGEYTPPQLGIRMDNGRPACW